MNSAQRLLLLTVATLSVLTASAAHSNLTIDGDARLCVDTQMFRLRTDMAFNRYWTVHEFQSVLSMIYCPNKEDECHVCSGIHEEMHYYSAGCATKNITIDQNGRNNSPMSCEISEPCTDVDDWRCQKKAREIMEKKVCNFSRTADALYVEGPHEVYCEKGCASAVFYFENRRYTCSGCNAWCNSWLEDNKKNYPEGEAKFCPDADRCRIEGKPDAADEPAADEGRASAWTFNRPGRALASAAALLSLGLVI